MRWALALVPLALAHPALAETGYRCDFTAACATGADCVPAAARVEIGLDEEGAALVFLAEANPVPAARLSDDPASFAFELEGGGTGMITAYADGTALNSRHSARPGTPVTTFFGTCEVVE